MKIVKYRNLMGLFFSIFMMLPMIAIGVRCAYITFNKNAKDSYYGETINEDNVVHPSSILVNQEYSWISNNVTYSEDLNIQNYYVQYMHNIIYTNADGIDYDTLLSTASYFRFYTSNTVPQFTVYNDSGILLKQFDVVRYGLSFDFMYLGTNNSVNQATKIQSYVFFHEYNKYSYLDNAFIYSVHEITDNNLGKIDFFIFFANMFLDLNNPKTQTYVNFVNWYFNYMLLVSLAYLLFFVIMWFINYIRQILEKGNSLGHGGF